MSTEQYDFKVTREEKLLVEASRAMKEYPINVLAWYCDAMTCEIAKLKKRCKKEEWDKNTFLQNSLYKRTIARNYKQEMNRSEE